MKTIDHLSSAQAPTFLPVDTKIKQNKENPDKDTHKTDTQRAYEEEVEEDLIGK